MKKQKILSIFLWVVFIAAVSWLVFWVATLPKIPQGEFLSKNGLHWHVTLNIKIKGEDVAIPAGIGLGAVHNPIHTHDPDDVVHLEFDGIVKKEDVALKNFFKVWGKDFSKESILGNKTGDGGTVKMFINGKENTEFENYLMQDGDKIEIVYE